MISAKVSKKDRLFAKLIKLAPEAEKELVTVNNQSADEMVALARSYVPVDDGVLRDSIRKVPAARGAVSVEAGGPTTTKPVRQGVDASYDYALGQEYGTRHNPARPFFWPAYRLMRKRLRNRASRAINRVVKRVVAS